MKHSLLLFLMIFCFASGLQAQQVRITGKVTDAADGLGLPGVNIIVEETNTGTVTDVNGSYTIEVDNDAVLSFSFVGYTTKLVPVNNQSRIDVALEMDVTQLSEVVVVGYGSQRKEDATGAVTAIGEEDFNRGVTTSPQDLIRGRVAGVQITNDGGAPGSGSTIRIRGGSSLYASNDPLIVVDGVPLDAGGISGLRNPLSMINPNDIASFSILKDASATAIYGARASNGVIIITTKRGKADAGLSVSYSGTMSVSTIPRTVDVMSGDEFRTMVQQRVENGETSAPAVDLLGTANTDWQDEIFETALGTEHNVTLTGSLEAMPYRASVGYSNHNGILRTGNFERTTLSVGLDPSFLDDHLKVNINFKGALAKNRFANEGAIGSAVTFDPTQPVHDPSSPFGGYFYWASFDKEGNKLIEPIGIAPVNPVALIEQRKDIANVNRYIGNAQFEYKFPFLPELTAHANIALDQSETEGSVIIPEAASFEYDLTNGFGRNAHYTAMTKNELLETYLKYKRDLPGLSSNVELMGGYSWQHFYRENTNEAYSFDESGVKDPFSVDKSENFLVSFYGRLNYTFKNRYLLTATLRRDGSSRFSGDNQWGTFMSTALAWKIKEESFLRDVEFLSDLKLRVGYGETGQENVGPAYPAIPTVTFSDNKARYRLGDTYYNTLRYNGYDEFLKWEETVTYNAGLDYGFLDGRISGSVDYYFRKTNDLLNVIPIPIGTNFTNELLTNVGNLENQGIEISLDATVIDQDDFSWDAGFNLSRNVNKITKLTAVDNPDFIGNLTGGIGGGVGNQIQVNRVGESANSFFVYEQVYNESGKPVEGLYIDQNEDGIINDLDRIVKEDPAPDVFMGFSSQFNYKKFSLGFNARMNLNNYVYNNVASQYATYINIYTSQGYLNNLATSVNESGFVNPQYFSDYYIRNASFFRMDNMTLGYDFGNITSKVRLNLNFTVQNAFVITKYEGLDPEVFNGIDNNIYPRPRTFLLGVNINFQN